MTESNESTCKSTEKIKFTKTKFQYLAIFVANIVGYSHGFGVGWLSSAVPALKAEDTPLDSGPLSLQQESWLGGSYPLGALTGEILFSLLLNFTSLKITMMAMAIPNLIFWLSVLLSKSYTGVVVGRFIGGFSGGGILLCIPLFVAEVASKEIRGFLGLMSPLSIAVGVLVAYICAAFVHYNFMPYCIVGFPVLFLLVMCVIPETPHTLIRQKKLEKAEQSLKFYNNGNRTDDNVYNVKEDSAKLQLLVRKKQEEKEKHSYTMILQRDSLKKVFIGISLVGLSVCSGIIVVTMNVVKLFLDSGSKMNPHISAIIVGVLQVCGICVSSVLVDKIGRKILFGVSSLLSALSLIVFGTFSFLNQKGVNLSSVDWLPVLSLSFYIFVNCIGLRTVPFLYISEILPYNVRQSGLAICMIAMSSFAFLTVFTKPILQDAFDLHVVIWMYAGVCVVGFFFSIFVMVETKGKNLNKVQET
ncbi:facilitated trehalose transporter Tret1-2 homolog [Bradysia coprophila]|uniref:facilitated trehalose transporter Tret1-2 homolog n=1 Tax=Bradysia coprophila TaxID=38358 RepID=UPI00187D71E4|nr:facilitated trehalose transporter Tret1-2 homolog [Bradysia coprophila]XP_037038931.1 facilitated trehalose transporter Tret1-2 homolog [Bradysia coprophila]XP_037038932.1 facilitated trehalose transporter Tret1-2 homolog [Bradysia coprophila]